MSIGSGKAAPFLFALLTILSVNAYADDAPDAAVDTQTILHSLHPRSGKVSIANGVAELNVGPKFVYFDANDATTYLTKVLGNPPSAVAGNDGMIVPTDPKETWFAVLAYSTEGHVTDSDASSINYDDLLKKIQSDGDEQAKEQRAAGFKGFRIIGWAQRPYYDALSKKLYWAKSLQFDNDPHVTLNYDIRILGRTGYINMKIVDDLDKLGTINSNIPEILSMVNFTATNTYADYVAGTDHLAAYGIAGLIAGGVLAKVGFFKGLMLLFAAFWKVIAAAVVGAVAFVGNFFRNLFRRKPSQ
jgi:uncharacterized membrane-anchored protein